MTAGGERSGSHWLNRFRNAGLGRALEKHLSKLVTGVLLAGLIALIAESAGSVGRAIEIGADEHCEVMKGFLWANGFPLYRQVWNDQPPLHTVLLGLCFKCFGAK